MANELVAPGVSAIATEGLKNPQSLASKKFWTSDIPNSYKKTAQEWKKHPIKQTTKTGLGIVGGTGLAAVTAPLLGFGPPGWVAYGLVNIGGNAAISFGVNKGVDWISKKLKPEQDKKK